jgi:hypothetical protein
VNANVPVALVGVSVDTVIDPLPMEPVASQLTVEELTRAAVSELLGMLSVPTCAGVLNASVVLSDARVPDTIRKLPVPIAATVIVPDHEAPSMVAVIVP